MGTNGHTFRFAAQRAFLTYSQTTLSMTPDWLLENHTKILEKVELTEYLICQEIHADGGYHLHCYLKFNRKLDTKNSRFFDVMYYSQRYHPNVQKVKNVHSLWSYLKKDNVYITNMKETRPKWLVILDGVQSQEEAHMAIMWNPKLFRNYSVYRSFMKLLELRKLPERAAKPVATPPVRRSLLEPLGTVNDSKVN